MIEHFHLTPHETARLRVRIIPFLKGYQVKTWLARNGIYSGYKKITEPSTWRVSYGVFRRLAIAMGTTADQLYEELHG